MITFAETKFDSCNTCCSMNLKVQKKKKNKNMATERNTREKNIAAMTTIKEMIEKKLSSSFGTEAINITKVYR